MNTLISRTTTIAYKKAVKPLLFTQQPDKVHEHLLSSGSKLQKASPLRELINRSWAYKNPALSQNVFGLDFLNPVGLSAGFDKNFELPPILKSVGFGFMEGGSLTYKPYEGNPRPWFTRLPKSKSIVVYAGLANQGVENIIKRLEGYPSNVFKNFPLNISVAKTNSPQHFYADISPVENQRLSLERCA